MMTKQTPTQSPLPKITLLPVPLSVANGHLLYCIRQANPTETFIPSPDLAHPPIRYQLSKPDGLYSGAGDSGDLILWPSGEQTYFERRKPPQPEKRFAVEYILRAWYRKQAAPPAEVTGLRGLITQIIDHLVNDKPGDIEFGTAHPTMFIPHVIYGIHKALALALGEPVPTGDSPTGESPVGESSADDSPVTLDWERLMEQAVYDWVAGPHSVFSFIPPEPESELSKTLRSVWQRISRWFVSSEADDIPTIRSLTVEQQNELGLGRLRELVELCAQRTYQERLDFQEQVVASFLERVNQLPSVESPALAVPVEQSQLPIWETIDEDAETRQIIKLWHEGLTAGEIGVRIGKAEQTVRNRISDLRTKYGQDILPGRRPRK